MNKILYEYDNGNAHVVIKEDGTREVTTEDDEFVFEVPLNADIKISDRCKFACKMCHENSTPNGDLAPLENLQFLKTWGIGKECSLGGGALTEHPQLTEILQFIKDCDLIANGTFHQDELVENFELIKSLQDKGLLKGIGISYSHEDERLVECVKQLNNVVFHVIAGLVPYKNLIYLSEKFNKPKLLVLGYKNFRRGNVLYNIISEHIESNIELLSHGIGWLLAHFSVVSFDNKGLEQLNVQKWVDKETWNECYQGDDRVTGMYIDAVKGEFAGNSTSVDRYPLRDNIKEMYDIIRNSIQEDVNIDRLIF